jgi:hypothetical protein
MMNKSEWSIIILFLCLLLLIMLFTGCDLKDQDTTGYEPSCQVFIKCLYLNQNNPDKSVCLSLADGCKSANDFNACLNPVLKDNKMDLRDCLLLMRK